MGKLNNTSKDTLQGSARTWIKVFDSRIHNVQFYTSLPPSTEFGTAFVSMSLSLPIYKTR